MGDRPILFSAPMVRALLGGQKTQTRRVIKPQPEPWRDFHLEGGCQQADWSVKTGTQTDDGLRHRFGLWMHCAFHESRFQPLPYAPGDRLYVRETIERANDEAVGYPANGDWLPNTPWMWKRPKLPAIHMPRVLSRLTLLVTEVRVQRLQDCSEADAIAEGYDPLDAGPNTFPTDWYADLWDSINGAGSWDANPWVVCLTFTIHQVNIDAMEVAHAP